MNTKNIVERFLENDLSPELDEQILKALKQYIASGSFVDSLVEMMQNGDVQYQLGEVILDQIEPQLVSLFKKLAFKIEFKDE